MAYTTEWNPILDNEEVKRTICKLHNTFMYLPFMNFNTVLKIVVTDKDRAHIYSTLGKIFYYEPHPSHSDRLEQIEVKEIGS